MEWIIGLIVIAVIGAFVKAGSEAEEKKKADEEISERKERAKRARESILASGDKELINQLLLMEANYDGAGARKSGPASGNISPSALGTAAAVAGGVIVADAVTNSMHQAALEDALADVRTDLEAEADELRASLSDFGDFESDDDGDFNFEI